MSFKTMILEQTFKLKRLLFPSLVAPGSIAAMSANLSTLSLEYSSQSQLLDVYEPSAPISQDSSSVNTSVSQLVDMRELRIVIPDDSDINNSFNPVRPVRWGTQSVLFLFFSGSGG